MRFRMNSVFFFRSGDERLMHFHAWLWGLKVLVFRVLGLWCRTRQRLFDRSQCERAARFEWGGFNEGPGFGTPHGFRVRSCNLLCYMLG